MPRRNKRDREARAVTPPTNGSPAAPESPGSSRRRQITVAKKVERAASQAYRDAVHKAGSCDPLCVDYEPAQKNLEFTAESLITAREVLRDALFGFMEAQQ